MTDITIEKSPTPSDTGVRLSVAELKRRAAVLLPELRQGSEDRERNRILPYQSIRRIGSERLLTWRIPQAQGGSGASVRDVIEFVIDVASVDSNVAQALRPSFLFLEGLLAGDDEAARQRWLPHYLDGELFGNAGWEVGGANGAISASLVREGTHYRANGSKYYSTGALYSDWVSAVAIDEKGREVRFMLPRNREGLELIDDFDAMGQRLTASGTTNLNNVLVYEEDIVPQNLYSGGRSQRSIVTPYEIGRAHV